MKYWLCLFVLSIIGYSSVAQEVYDSRYGYSLSPYGTMRILTICVNIVYDQTPERDPFYQTATPQWQAGNPDLLNDAPPAWLNNFLDADFTGDQPRGLMTRYFYESSLGNLIMLGDFVVVNIRQSSITSSKPGTNFTFGEVVRAAVDKINELGGVRTIGGHHAISDFDMREKGSPGKPKKQEANGKIDFVMIFTRNTVRKEENGRVTYNYGQNNPGEGYSYESPACSKCPFLIDGQYCENEITTVQAVGVADYSQSFRNIAFHEFAHTLFGNNAFHSAGGNHFGTSNASVFPGLQGGYGLMGGYNSSLVSCNAYDRWRLGWTDTLMNPAKLEICANGSNSNIRKDDGPKSLILRDFVSTGDAVRVELPYVDSNASKQYLWLENHQVGRNHKLDFLQFSNEDACREAGSPGIYAYIQVGRDRRTGAKMNDVFTGDETDNLRFLTAKGNWDMRLEPEYDTLTCIAWKHVKPVESYDQQNPFTGYNDLQTHIWDQTGKTANFSDQSLCSYPYRIRRNGQNEPELPFLGDNQTAFRNGAVIDLCSNPASVNVLTYYTTQYNQKFATYARRINTRKIYLSGLSIKMKQLAGGEMQVDVCWDKYDVDHNVRWTGDIVLKEQLILEKGGKLLLDQGGTPTQLKRDSISGLFAVPSSLSCEHGSHIEVKKGGTILLQNRSALVLRSGSILNLKKGGKLIIKRGSSLIVEEGAVLLNEGGKIKRQ